VKHQPCVITLMTDFSDQDAYVGIMKGVITEVNPRANIIDICHSIPPQDIFKGAYLLYTSYKYFPKGTIHVAVVDPGVGSKRNIVCVETRNYLFLTPDNGILGFIIQEERPKRIIRVTNNNYFLPAPSNTFHGRDVFAPVAAHLSLGIKPKQLGNATKQLEHLSIPQPVRKNTRQLEGQIISIDRFGNLVTNITKSHLEEYVREQIRDLDRKSGVRSQKPKIRNQTPDEPGKSSKKKMLLPYNTLETTIGKKEITGIVKTYTDVKTGKPLILFGSAGFLEISVNQGNAQKYFTVDKGNRILISWMHGTSSKRTDIRHNTIETGTKRHR